MKPLLVVSNPRTWPIPIDDVDVVAAREYLTSPAFAQIRSARVVNACGG